MADSTRPITTRGPAAAVMPIAIVLAFALLLGTIEAVSLHAGAARVGRPISWPRAMLGTFPSWLLTILLAWPVRWLSQRARIGARTWMIGLPVHIVGAAVFSVGLLFGSAAIFVAMGLVRGTVLQTGLFFVRESLADEVAIYCAMVAAFHALDFSRESAERERERERLLASLTEAQLSTLRSQLRPHFFFNTLNAISSLALERRPEDLVDMVGALGDLVRSSLDADLPHEVPLSRELDLLDLYLKIQRVRFEDWLRVEMRIDPGAADILVPSLVLQPLVENAIEHGTQDGDGLSRVTVRCRREGADLLLEIENRFVATRGDTNGSRLGTGLHNTRSRLECLYPGRYVMRGERTADDGFVVTIRIPARSAPAPAATE